MALHIYTPEPIFPPCINFLNLTVSEIQPRHTFFPPTGMGENNTQTVLKGCGVRKKELHGINKRAILTFNISIIEVFRNSRQMCTHKSPGNLSIRDILIKVLPWMVEVTKLDSSIMHGWGRSYNFYQGMSNSGPSRH